MFDPRPIFGICGFSGSGKTTLLEQAMPRLAGRGLRVAVVKHDVHGLARDEADKDSDRLFRAGADVVVRAPGELLARFLPRDEMPLEQELDGLAGRYDLVLLEGFKRRPGHKVWLLGRDEAAPPAELGPYDAVLAWGADRAAIVDGLLTVFLKESLQQTPLFGCVHARDSGAAAWLDRAASRLEPHCRQVVFTGAVPEDRLRMPHLPDVPDPTAPAAGLLAAMRWAPRASWLFLPVSSRSRRPEQACAVPASRDRSCRNVEDSFGPTVPSALDAWDPSVILAEREPGIWAVIPRPAKGAEFAEPVLSWFDYRFLPTVERHVGRSSTHWRVFIQHPKCRIASFSGEP